MKAYGAELILTDASKGMNGAIERAKQLHENIPDSYILHQVIYFDLKTNFFSLKISRIRRFII